MKPTQPVRATAAAAKVKIFLNVLIMDTSLSGIFLVVLPVTVPRTR
jgi:hypothetical protein